MNKYIAECLGTFTLSLVVLMAISVGGGTPIPVPLIAGLTLGLFVYTIGNISGSHINPAVTVGIWSLKKISTRDATGYIISQVVGGILAFAVSTIIFQMNLGGSLNQPHLTMQFIAECLGAFFFTFGIASVVLGKTPNSLSGVVVGGSLLFGLIVASLAGSAAILNPAVGVAVMLATHSFAWIYIVAPIVGAWVGMQAYSKLSE